MAKQHMGLPGESLRRNIVIQNQLEKVKAVIRRFPVPALFAGLGAGIVLGIALRRR